MVSPIKNFFDRKAPDIVTKEKIKITFQYVLMLISSAVIGIIFLKILPDGYINESVFGISKHFDLIFSECDVFPDALRCILSYSTYDLVITAIIALSSFTVFNYIVSDICIICTGFKFGFSVSFLAAFISGGVTETVYRLGIMRYLIFVSFKAIIASLLIWFAYRISVISFGLKKYTSVGRTVLKPDNLVKLFLYYISFSGLILILNGMYCLFIYLVK